MHYRRSFCLFSCRAVYEFRAAAFRFELFPLFGIPTVSKVWLFLTTAMSEPPAIEEPEPEDPPASSQGSQAEAKASPKRKREARPKIDLDDEIRRANELASVSRKMLAAARNTSRNNKKAKQRLIKKAGKLSPEDLERIAVLKRCGLFVEEGNDEDNEGDDGEEAPARKKVNLKGPSPEEKKRPKLEKAVKVLTENNPILQEVGVASFQLSSGSASSSSSDVNTLPPKKKGLVRLSSRARLPCGPSVEEDVGDSQVE